MGKLSIFKNGKSKDYRFLDRIVGQTFNVGGTIFHVHKYLGVTEQGTSGSVTSTSELTIQDMLFLENRDRSYEKDVIDLKGQYTINDLDFNLTQFGIVINTNVLFINFHINQMIDRLGRKLMPGDVLEIEHRKEDAVLDPDVATINAFYVVKDTARAAEGYSPTWLAHIWRVRAEPLTDSQEYKDILSQIQPNGSSLADIISTYNKSLEITAAIQAEGAENVPTRNFNSANLYINPPGTKLPSNNLIPWTFNGDGVPLNQNAIAAKGTRWPDAAMDGDYFLRTDYNPPRLYQRHENKWCAVEVDWRDRDWTPAHRSLEDHLDDTKITTLTSDPSSPFNERQPIHNPIKSKQDLPINPTNILPGEEE